MTRFLFAAVALLWYIAFKVASFRTRQKLEDGSTIQTRRSRILSWTALIGFDVLLVAGILAHWLARDKG